MSRSPIFQFFQLIDERLPFSKFGGLSSSCKGSLIVWSDGWTDGQMNGQHNNDNYTLWPKLAEKVKTEPKQSLHIPVNRVHIEESAPVFDVLHVILRNIKAFGNSL